MHILHCTAHILHCQKSALYLEKQKSWKNSAKCALCSANKCALCSSVRSDLTAPFKPPAKKKRLLKVSLKSVENWKNCRQISFRACLPVSPFKKVLYSVFRFKSKADSTWHPVWFCLTFQQSFYVVSNYFLFLVIDWKKENKKYHIDDFEVADSADWFL